MTSANHCTFSKWVLDNEDAIRDSGVAYRDSLITPETETVCYHWVVSLLFITLSGKTARQVAETVDSGLLPKAVTLLLGWWGFPWGPFRTISALWTNFGGGERVTVETILASRWGVHVSDLEANASQQRFVCDITDAAIHEIEHRREACGQDSEMGVLLSIDDEFQRTCRVQFDFPVSDGSQWVFRNAGLTFLIRKLEADKFEGRVLDFRGERFEILEKHEVSGIV